MSLNNKEFKLPNELGFRTCKNGSATNICYIFVAFFSLLSACSKEGGASQHSTLVVARLGAEIVDGGWYLEEIGRSTDQPLIANLVGQIKSQPLERHRITTFYPDIYAITLDANGDSVCAARFNSGLFQPVKIMPHSGKWVILSSEVEAKELWGRAPELNQSIRQLVAARQKTK